jgi:hypothetical protein
MGIKKPDIFGTKHPCFGKHPAFFPREKYNKFLLYKKREREREREFEFTCDSGVICAAFQYIGLMLRLLSGRVKASYPELTCRYPRIDVFPHSLVVFMEILGDICGFYRPV